MSNEDKKKGNEVTLDLGALMKQIEQLSTAVAAATKASEEAGQRALAAETALAAMQQEEAKSKAMEIQNRQARANKIEAVRELGGATIFDAHQSVFIEQCDGVAGLVVASPESPVPVLLTGKIRRVPKEKDAKGVWKALPEEVVDRPDTLSLKRRKGEGPAKVKDSVRPPKVGVPGHGAVSP